MESWYVVNTKPKNEVIAEENLQRQSFMTYLPWIRLSRRRRGKWVKVIEPMFPGYLFVRLDPKLQSVAPIRSTRGVLKLVSFGHSPKTISDNIINDLKNTADRQTGLHSATIPLFEKGDVVNVVSGPLQGLRGIYQATTKNERVTILMELLGMTHSVLMRRDDIVPDDLRIVRERDFSA